MTISTAKRAKIEKKIYTVMSKLDKSGINTKYYKDMFAKMNDRDFEKLMKSDFPFRFHHVPFKVEPKTSDIVEALDYLGVPLLEKVSLEYLYQNSNGKPVYSKPCLVVYVHLKKVQQFATHKNSIANKIGSRDMKTGLLTWGDKGGKESDRESESLLAIGLEKTSKEFTTVRADAMQAKAEAYNMISNTGTLTLDDIKVSQSDSISKNLLDTYIIGCMGISNLITPSYETKYTLERKGKK